MGAGTDVLQSKSSLRDVLIAIEHHLCTRYKMVGITATPSTTHGPLKNVDEITYTFPNLNSCTVEYCQWIINLIPRVAGHVITYV